MYYILYPTSECEKRKVFIDRRRLSDGNTVLTLSDLRYIRFTLGEVTILNASDMKAYEESLKK